MSIWTNPWSADKKLDNILKILVDIQGKEKKIMAEIDDLNVAVAKLQDDSVAVKTAVDDLKKTIADLQAALAADDSAALKAQIVTATEALNKVDTDLDAIAPA